MGGEWNLLVLVIWWPLGTLSWAGLVDWWMWKADCSWGTKPLFHPRVMEGMGWSAVSVGLQKVLEHRHQMKVILIDQLSAYVCYLWCTGNVWKQKLQHCDLAPLFWTSWLLPGQWLQNQLRNYAHGCDNNIPNVYCPHWDSNEKFCSLGHVYISIIMANYLFYLMICY